MSTYAIDIEGGIKTLLTSRNLYIIRLLIDNKLLNVDDFIEKFDNYLTKINDLDFVSEIIKIFEWRIINDKKLSKKCLIQFLNNSVMYSTTALYLDIINILLQNTKELPEYYLCKLSLDMFIEYVDIHNIKINLSYHKFLFRPDINPKVREYIMDNLGQISDLDVLFNICKSCNFKELGNELNKYFDELCILSHQQNNPNILYKTILSIYYVIAEEEIKLFIDLLESNQIIIPSEVAVCMHIIRESNFISDFASITNNIYKHYEPHTPAYYHKCQNKKIARMFCCLYSLCMKRDVFELGSKILNQMRIDLGIIYQ